MAMGVAGVALCLLSQVDCELVLVLQNSNFVMKVVDWRTTRPVGPVFVSLLVFFVEDDMCEVLYCIATCDHFSICGFCVWGCVVCGAA